MADEGGAGLLHVCHNASVNNIIGGYAGSHTEIFVLIVTQKNYLMTGKLQHFKPRLKNDSKYIKTAHTCVFYVV